MNMSYKVHSNFERKASHEVGGANSNLPMTKDEKLIENLRKLVKDYIEIVEF